MLGNQRRKKERKREKEGERRKGKREGKEEREKKEGKREEKEVTKLYFLTFPINNVKIEIHINTIVSFL